MLFPMSYSSDRLPPPSINIFLLLGVTIKVQSPCPTSTKYTFNSLFLNFKNEKSIITQEIRTNTFFSEKYFFI